MQAFETALDAMGNRIASFDAAAATAAAELMAARQKRGRPGDLRDTMIAGIVLAHRATLATRNTADFEETGIELLNPWKLGSGPTAQPARRVAAVTPTTTGTKREDIEIPPERPRRSARLLNQAQDPMLGAAEAPVDCDSSQWTRGRRHGHVASA